MTKSGNQVQLSQREKECLLRAVEDIERQYIQLADWSDNWNDANESGWKDSGIWKQKD
jgi:hypothetical protein